MGGKVGLGGRVVLAALLAGALLFGVAERGNSADPVSYTVSIGNVSAGTLEGDSAGANSVSFPITVSPGAAPNDIAVTYTSSEGLVQSFTIPANTASTTMPVQINGNTTAEDDRTLTVDLTAVDWSPSGSNATDSVAVGTPSEGKAPIIDDDWRLAGLASNPANATVSEAGGGTIDFTVALVDAANNQPKDAPAHHPIKVDFTLADGTGAGGAVYGHDYQTTDPSGKKSGTLVFAPTTHVVHVKVQGISDNVYGLDKQFTLTLSNPVGASFVAGATIAETGTITEASAAPIIGVGSCGTVTGGTDATFPLTTSYASPLPATVTWTTADVSTVSGDYDGGTGTATVPAGTRNGSITIHTHANPPSGDRVFKLTISNGQHTTILSSAATANCTVHQPSNVGTDKLPSLQITDPAPVAQPAAGKPPVQATIKVTLNPPAVSPSTPQPVNVHWQTQAGTATAPADYTDASGDLHWDAGTFGPQSFTVQINPFDGNATSSEKFTVQFTTISAAFVGSSAANVTIVPPTSPPLISVVDASANESAGSIPAVVSLAPAPTGPVTVHYATADGSAKAGTDYTAVSGTLSFAAGQTAKTVSVPIADDNVVEPNRYFTFALSAPTGGTLGNATATLTIRNDDSAAPAPPPVVSTNPGPPQTSRSGPDAAAQGWQARRARPDADRPERRRQQGLRALHAPLFGAGREAVPGHDRAPGPRPAEEEEGREEGASAADGQRRDRHVHDQRRQVGLGEGQGLEAGADAARRLPPDQGEGHGEGEGSAERQGHHRLVRDGAGAGAPDHRQEPVITSRSARSASSFPIASEAVAAGDGALSTCIIRCEPTIRKSSTSRPSRPRA